MVLKFKEIPNYSYPLNVPNISFGTFLKHESLSHPTLPSWELFEDVFKKENNLKSVIYARQVHKNDILFADDQQVDYYLSYDAIITQSKRKALLGFHADCQITFFYDPVQEVIAIAHAGFRGQTLSIYTQVIEAMKNRYRSCAKDIYAIMSFSLCKNHAEFINYEKEFPMELWIYKDEHHRFDLKKMAHDELIKNGILEEKICMNFDCTAEDENLYYSYRAQKTSKRHISYIFLN